MKKLIIFLQTILLTLLIASCGTKEKVAENTEVLPPDIVELNADQIKMGGIAYDSIKNMNLSSDLNVNGIINVPPQNLVSVCLPLGGFIKSINIIPGKAVRKGQLLAIVENPEFIQLQQDYFENLSKLEFTEADYNRQKELYNQNASSAKSFQLVSSEYKSLKAKVNAIEQKLSMIGLNKGSLSENKISSSVQIVSPINGYVKSVNVNTGKYVNPTDVIFEITDNSEILLELTVFGKDIEYLKEGQNLRFYLSNSSTEEYHATVYQVGRSINEDKIVKVYAKVERPTINMLPGIIVNAIIESGERKVTSLPNDAFVRFDEKDYIFIFEQNKKENGKDITEFKMVEVKKGMTSGGFSEVILPGKFDINSARVVVKGAYLLLTAMKNAGEMAC
jgi:RND family efflux transporter MFP subunit